MIVDEKPPLDEDLLAHFGVKGMHWGARKGKIAKLGSYSSKAAVTDHDQATFRREVKAAKRGKGVASSPKGFARPEKDRNGILTGRWLGEHKDSKGRKVSVDFANAVLAKAVNEKKRKHYVKTGAAYATAVLAGTVGVRRLR